MAVGLTCAGLKTLKSSGILDAYQNLMTQLCKYGLPTGDLYEFSALTITKYEKKLKAQRKKDLEERLQKRGLSKEPKKKDPEPELAVMSPSPVFYKQMSVLTDQEVDAKKTRPKPAA